jgi:hypothetical protein
LNPLAGAGGLSFKTGRIEPPDLNPNRSRRRRAPSFPPAVRARHPESKSVVMALAGGLKIVHDLLPYRRFRTLKPPGENPAGTAGGPEGR